MLLFSLWRMDGPGRIAQCDSQFFSIRDFILQPCGDLTSKLEFAELGAEPGEQLGFEPGTIKPGCSVRFIGINRPALHEQSLARVERRKCEMPLSERRHFRLDVEQFSDEGIQVNRDFDQKLRFLLARKRDMILLAEQFKLLP